MQGVAMVMLSHLQGISIEFRLIGYGPISKQPSMVVCGHQIYITHRNMVSIQAACEKVSLTVRKAEKALNRS